MFAFMYVCTLRACLVSIIEIINGFLDVLEMELCEVLRGQIGAGIEQACAFGCRAIVLAL